MSALGGIYNFNGAPIDNGILAALGEHLSRWGPDGGSDWLGATIGMVYRAFHTTPKSRCEAQPLISRTGHILCWDGRVDNSEEIIQDLGDVLRGDRTDPAIVLASYLKWGPGFLSKLVGDFALSLWDPSTRSLLLARDPFGTRTLYYTVSAGRIFWASTLEPILELSGLAVELDDEYIADYLITQVPRPDVTPYKGIRGLEPGCSLTVQDGPLQHRRFWRPDSCPEIRYRTDSEYEEHFRSLFREAVRCRLYSDGPVWCGLSGGLDSTSVVFMADQVISSGEAGAARLETVSFVTEGSPTTDESNFIRYAEKKRGQRGYHLRIDELYMRFRPPEEFFLSKPSTALCSYDPEDRLCREMEKSGARVLLSGLGGDQLLWSMPDPSPELADLVYQRKPGELHRRLRLWSEVLRRPYVQLLWRSAVLPLLPEGMATKYRAPIKPPKWLSDKFVRRMNIHWRNAMRPDGVGHPLPSRQIRCTQLMYVISIVSAGHYRDVRATELRHPFLHRPLVQFLIGIPFDQVMRPGETRSIQRRALRHILPDKVLRRKGKGVVGESIYRGLSREWGYLAPLFRNARVSDLGYVTPLALEAAANLARQTGRVDSIKLMATISLELWLRSLESRFKNSSASTSYAANSLHTTVGDGATPGPSDGSCRLVAG